MGTSSPSYNFHLKTPGYSTGTEYIYLDGYFNNDYVFKFRVSSGYPIGELYSTATYRYVGTSSYRWTTIYLQFNPDVSSDSRVKKDITLIPSGVLNKLIQINPITYRLKDSVEMKNNINKTVGESNKKFEAGFIAQDLEKLFPEVVTKDENGMYGIQYASMIPFLVQGMKEQQAEIEALKKLVDELTSNSKLKFDSQISDINNSNSGITVAKLNQNSPNPFTNNTLITMTIPTGISVANVYIYDMNGNQIKSITINERGNASITIKGSELKAGMYIYSLICDEVLIDTKQMLLTK